MLPAAAHAIGFRRSGVEKGIIQPPGKHRRRRLCRPLLLTVPAAAATTVFLFTVAVAVDPEAPSAIHSALLREIRVYIYMYIIKQSHTYRQHVYVTVTKAVDR